MAETTVLRSSASPRNASPTAGINVQTSGPLPVVAVTMGSGGRPIQTNGPAGAQKNVNVEVFPPRARLGAGNPAMRARMAALPAPAPAVPSLSADQLLLCRHLVAAYVEAQVATEGSNPENIKLAQETIDAIDKSAQAITDAAAQALAEPEAPAVPERRMIAAGAQRAQVGDAAPRRVIRAPSREPLEPVVIDLRESPAADQQA